MIYLRRTKGKSGERELSEGELWARLTFVINKQGHSHLLSFLATRRRKEQNVVAVN